MLISCHANVLASAFSTAHTLFRDREEPHPTTYISIVARQPDEVFLYASNDLGVTVRTELRVRVANAGSVAFPFHALFRAIGFLGDAELRMSVDKRQIGKIRCNTYLAEIAGLELRESDVLLFDDKPTAMSKLPAGRLKRALRQTLIAASREDSALNGLLIRLEGRECQLCATDRTRIAISSVDLIQGAARIPAEATVPRRAIETLASLLPQSEAHASIGLTDKQAWFEWPGNLMKSPIYETQFPKVDNVLPARFDFTTNIRTGRLLGVVGAVAPIATDKFHTVEVRCDGDRLEIHSDSPDIGSARDTIDLSKKGKPFGLAFNGSHIIQFLEAVDAEQVTFSVKHEDRATNQGLAFMLKPADREDYKYYIAPIVTES